MRPRIAFTAGSVAAVASASLHRFCVQSNGAPDLLTNSFTELFGAGDCIADRD